MILLNELNFVYPVRVIMCQHCMYSDTEIISRLVFFKESAWLHKVKKQRCFQTGHIVWVDEGNGVSSLVLFFFTTSFKSVEFSSFKHKWSLPNSTRPKTRLKRHALYGY